MNAEFDEFFAKLRFGLRILADSNTDGRKKIQYIHEAEIAIAAAKQAASLCESVRHSLEFTGVDKPDRIGSRRTLFTIALGAESELSREHLGSYSRRNYCRGSRRMCDRYEWTTMNGQPLNFSIDVQLIENRGIVASNGIIHKAVLEVITQTNIQDGSERQAL
ncbi:hypothetical protein ACQ4M3_14430 [Leptolyngbya sp. AN03gr2]|uniref:hypothetical protein n=1 Tax=unclassified Leptolyngbya TaxID=2650499 RepID=UPI003D324556